MPRTGLRIRRVRNTLRAFAKMLSSRSALGSREKCTTSNIVAEQALKDQSAPSVMRSTMERILQWLS